MGHTSYRLSFPVRLAALAGSLALSAMLPAQTPAPFPLELGNTWLYRPHTSNAGLAPDLRSISVHGRETVAGRDYFDVAWFGREVLLRVDPATGNLVIYDRASASEQIWIGFGAPLHFGFTTAINPCPTTGAIAARDAAITVPAGAFTDVLQVNFTGNCVDVGVTQQFYAPTVGLLSSEEETIAGPVHYELAYYRVGATTGSAPEVSFTLAIDAPQYSAGGTLTARVTLRSSSPTPIPLHFPNSQSFELKILNEKGDVVFLWSRNRTFATVVRDETFGPGEKTFGFSAPLADLPPGRYTAEGWLTTDPILYLADAGFTIVPAQALAPRRNHPAGVR
jgi:intracellular proteinase inhibitor BsuPI